VWDQTSNQNAVRELFDLGYPPQLDKIGVPQRENGRWSTEGAEIYAEPRAPDAGYRCRNMRTSGQLLCLLYQTLVTAPAQRRCSWARISGYSILPEGAA